ncbi:hypothetical protein ACWEQ3_30240 [Streptomyces mirabilis]
MTDQTEEQLGRLYAVRGAVLGSIRDSLEGDGWVFLDREDPFPAPFHAIEFEGYGVRITVDLAEYKSPILQATEEQLKERRRPALDNANPAA